MPKDTVYTAAFGKAHKSINRAFELARERTGMVPFGEHILDPRTVKKHNEWGQYGLEAALNAMDSKYVRPKDFDYKNHPLPKDKGPNPKTAAGGIVVDPTAIETAQGADNVSFDAGAGNSLGDGILEAG